ncbi:hypothetical protein R1sor_002546 [Riccia sorocarpa]|uniref:Ubiquitin-like domain-containing protein n=1 Tax=Riccia sorocarpa TaxID=122646 RepID=A0ABD3H1T8_9MARC
MQVFLRNIDGRSAVVHVEPGHTVTHLKRLGMPHASSSSLDELYLSHGGRILPDGLLLVNSSVKAGSTLSLGLRLRGGGGDGGATGAESRDCYLKMYADKKPDKVDPNEAKLAKSTRCTLSAEALKPPCVIDFLGNLYNKEAVVHALLTKSVPKKLKHIIKGLKDVIPIQLATIPGVSADDDSVETKFHCPITGQEFNGKFRFLVLRKCGHVLSARALKEVQTGSCLVCYTPFTDSDKIVINGTADEVAALRDRWEEEKLKSRGEKKDKKNSTLQALVTPKATGEVVENKEEIGLRKAKIDSFTDSQELVVNKRKTEGAVQGVEISESRPKGSDLVQPSKKFKAAEVLLPTNATKEIFASIFTSSSKNSLKETYSCRSLPLGPANPLILEQDRPADESKLLWHMR